MVKAYSYLRWSTDRQTAGDTLRRQLELSERYAADHGLELDHGLKDEGVSAYHGMNRRRGDLSIFLEQVETGIVEPGSFLLVESLDRISREQIVEAQTLFLRIINAGITLVTCLPHRQIAYSREICNKDPTLILMAVFEMIRANEESATKAERVARAREKGRQAARETGRTYTKNLPGWIMLDEQGNRVLNGREVLVREIFTWLAQGIGRHKIVNMLNERKEPVLRPNKEGRIKTGPQGWHASHIHHLLHNKTVIGVLQPCRVTWVDGRRIRTPLEPIEDYYEPAIDEDLYWKAHEATAKNRMGVGRKGKRFNNLLSAGLTRCDACGSHMNYQDKGAKSVPNLVCSAAVRRLCTNNTKYRYSRFEQAILNYVAEIRVEQLKPVEDRSLEIDLAAMVRRREGLTAEIENLYAEMGSGLKGLTAQIVKREADKERLEGDIESLRKTIARRGVAPSLQDHLAFVRSVRETMKVGTEEEIYAKRAQLARALREVVTDVRFDPEGYADLILLNGLAAYRIKNEGRTQIARAPSFAPNSTFVPPYLSKSERDRLTRTIQGLQKDGTDGRPLP
jgi:DNA invertase Pin-like site-specific DNA recombinase